MRHLFPDTVRKCFVALFLFSIIVFSYSCSYYKVVSYSSQEDTFTLESIEDLGLVFIIHDGKQYYSINEISGDHEKISGYINGDLVPFYYKEGRSTKYKYHTEKTITKEVHFYLKDEASIHIQPTGYVEILKSDLQEVRVIDLNKGATIIASLLTIAGVILAIIYWIGSIRIDLY